MKRLHSLAFYVLVTPAITLSSAALLAQQPTGKNVEREHQSTQRDDDAMEATPSVTQGVGNSDRANRADSSMKKDSHAKSEQSRLENRGYMNSMPVNGVHASDLIGSEVKTTGDKNVGPVNDLIIDEDGQIVAIVIGVGGFLGMAEKNVAIGWDDVKRTGTSDKQVLRIDITRDELRSAPEIATLD